MSENDAAPDAPIHRITLLFAGRTQAEVNATVTAMHARAQEHAGYVGILVDAHTLDLDFPPS